MQTRLDDIKTGMRMVTTPNMFPLVKSIDTVPIAQNGYHDLLQKTWYIMNRDNMVWLKPNRSKQEILEQYIKNLDIVSLKSEENFPHGMKKRIARIASKYDLDLSIVGSYLLKLDSKTHASYNFVLNQFKVVPEYFIRQGTIRIGDSQMVPEFEKTFLHEFGHAIWHQLLTSKQKIEYLNLVPRFEENVSVDDANKYMRGFTNTLDGKIVHSQFYTLTDAPFVSDYARFNPKEDFAESWVWYNIAPSKMKSISPERYEFIHEIHPYAIDWDIKKVQVDIGEKEFVDVTDLVVVDLQYNAYRRKLAQKLEVSLMSYVADNGLSRDDIKNVVLYGDYVKLKAEPENIKAVVVVDGLDNDAVELEKDNVRIWICNGQAIADKLTYELRALGDGNKKPTINKRISKARKVKAPTISKYRLETPVESVYSLQKHTADRAGKHYDLRVAMDKRAYSWALPKGLPKGKEKKLAILQPAHKKKYMGWSGEIKRGYGKGTVEVSDHQGVDVTDWGKNKSFSVFKGKNKGHYTLRPYKKNWLISKNEYRKSIKKKLKFGLARLKFIPDMLKKKRFWMAPILTGSRHMMYVEKGENRFVSKKGTERTDNVPHLRNAKFREDLDGTVTDGEMFKKNYKTTSKIMGSSPIVARDKQKKIGKLKYLIFDVLKYKGRDVRRLPFEKRRKIIKNIVRRGSGDIKAFPLFKSNKKKNYKKLLEQGWEGAVFYAKDKPYGNAYVARKRRLK